MSDNKENQNERMTDHEYDGIKELDNFLPSWWLGILWGTIIFAAGYWGYYHMGPGPSIKAEFDQGQARIAMVKAQREQASNAGGAGEAELVAMVKDTAKTKAGAAVYAGKCASCHGPQGQGGIGPNLTDDNWIHGGKITEIVKVVTNGVGDKGMPPWGPVLTKDELYQVVAYVKSIRGTNPPNPKAPQGELVKE